MNDISLLGIYDTAKRRMQLYLYNAYPNSQCQGWESLLQDVIHMAGWPSWQAFCLLRHFPLPFIIWRPHDIQCGLIREKVQLILPLED